MSFIGANDHLTPISPEDPLYYAPRSARGMANPRSNGRPQRSDGLPPTPPLSRYDEMREEPSRSHPSAGVAIRLRTPSTTRTVRHCGRNCRSDRRHCDPGARLFNVFPRSKSEPSELAVSISTPASATPAQATTSDNSRNCLKIQAISKHTRKRRASCVRTRLRWNG